MLVYPSLCTLHFGQHLTAVGARYRPNWKIGSLMCIESRLDGIGEIKQLVRQPAVAIGGTKVDNACQVLRIADAFSEVKEAICSRI